MSVSTFVLPDSLSAHEPPEARGVARDAVRLLVSDAESDSHRTFADLPSLLSPGDLIVVNNSATLPAAVRLDRLSVHFSTAREDGTWLVELRRPTLEPYAGGAEGEWLPLPGARRCGCCRGRRRVCGEPLSTATWRAT
ncbi:S-adenosylmethionine:tRNA ribosyltransferase-isomerase [Nonomuraea recticatena]|uniref:S-adenosylmethionine:tRNA ribosyltransferase-isomerase n=1 Tax=Nonomuraea recticatena TaxID=46178 RepID=UPI00361088AA